MGMDWRKRRLDELLHEEFKQRGFYLVGSTPLEWAPMIGGFKTHAAMEKFLSLESVDYKYVAYKNLAVTVGLEPGNKHEVTACLFVKMGSVTRMERAFTELVTFYRGRMYKHASICNSFFFLVDNAGTTEDLKAALREEWRYVEVAVDRWQDGIRTLIMENRWPEEEYIGDLKFLEEE